MEENKFIKVLTYDNSCADSLSIVNIDVIERFEIETFYDENFVTGVLYLKGGTEIYVREEGIELLQKDLVGKIEKAKKKVKIKKENENFEEYLDSNRDWNKSKGISDRMFILQNITNKHKEEIAEKIKLMGYQEFLRTPYWKAISAYLKIVKKKCEKCGSKLNLHTHHKTYEHHGYEVLHLEDLEVVCSNCHCKMHKEKK